MTCPTNGILITPGKLVGSAAFSHEAHETAETAGRAHTWPAETQWTSSTFSQ